ncbi:hypothetical protein [Paraburkholderia panacisoli]|nr:hypothetical protein [Paraburkholderia panacisoli]
MLKLVRIEAAMLELKTARADFDDVFTFGRNLQCGRSDVGSVQGND